MLEVVVFYFIFFQVSGTGHAGMEATIANCLEPGETIVVANSGIWGQRVCDLSERYGGMLTALVPFLLLYATMSTACLTGSWFAMCKQNNPWTQLLFTDQSLPLTWVCQPDQMTSLVLTAHSRSVDVHLSFPV